MQPNHQNQIKLPAAPPLPTREDLETALNLFAKLVDKYGTDYLPFFLRIERELIALEEEKDALSRAKARARLQGSTRRA
ncbi:hypothetical protein PsAD2_00425 [Pseudovibrio axinellae]|uniref:Uncharacterized protein n=1 Tax=Pseudovibrio axinellae TaxID=989403 RepID=A0A166AI28_9HYPH|nr:hypothetical protein [Pseudovibrio axinellae]KZL21141.1 hypothetical protein PsAD2_00425 [Pseudovibrio axinellae]SEQ89124.1 hypothetical protein SAMN05421798_10529 [Pseudovibrio axinellae]